MPDNLNFDSQYPLTHESAGRVVAAHHEALRRGNAQAARDLLAAGGDVNKAAGSALSRIDAEMAEAAARRAGVVADRVAA